MKLSRLESTTQRHSREAVARAEEAGEQQVRRVEPMEGLEGDKERSLQQERAEVEALAIGDFAGGPKMLEDARQLANELSELGDEARNLVNVAGVSPDLVKVDSQA
ncbi:MAG: hypothetical protein L6Q40_02235 [Azonexus sp.]|nr:hypothetical protein [Azonexus sp.]